MEIIEEERYIPAKTYIEKKYISCDGQVFASEGECLRHEQYIQTQNHPVYQSKMTGICMFDDDNRSADMYYISDASDYDFLAKTQSFDKRLKAEYDTYGPGWYLFWEDDACNYCLRYQYLIYYSAYVNDIEKRWKLWKDDVYQKMMERGCCDGD